MGKTETIKQRAICIYIPSIEMAERWMALPNGAGTSISKFVAEHVENSLRQEGGEGYRSRSSLIEEKLSEALQEEDERIRYLDPLVEKLRRTCGSTAPSCSSTRASQASGASRGS